MIIMTLPPMKLQADDLLLAYSHRAMLNPAIEESWKRLAFLGEKLLDLAIVRHWFEKDPDISAEELQDKQVNFLSHNGLLQQCVTEYSLETEIPCPSLDAPIGAQECRDFLAINVAKLYEQGGIVAMQGWVSALIDPGSPPPRELANNATPTQGPMDGMPPPEPSETPPPAPPYSPTDDDNGPLSFVTLAMFNAYAEQRQNHRVSWDADPSGESHRLTWTVKCLLDGQVRATAQASSQKVAKEKAAREVWRLMGWSTAAPAPSSPPLSPRLSAPSISAALPAYSTDDTAHLTWLSLSVFHEMAQKHRHQVVWTQDWNGQPHMPYWTVTCKIDGETKGTKTAKNTKEAKLLAAREAWKNMGWGGMPPA